MPDREEIRCPDCGLRGHHETDGDCVEALRERVAVLTEEVAEWKAASMHHDPESGVKANAAGWCVSWKAERRRVTVLTEERDELLTENAAYDRSLADHVRMLGDAEARVAVLTEERDAALYQVGLNWDELLAFWKARYEQSQARVAVLEAGLRELADAADAMSASRTAWNAPSLNRSLRDAATAARALVGGVPATLTGGGPQTYDQRNEARAVAAEERVAVLEAGLRTMTRWVERARLLWGADVREAVDADIATNRALLGGVPTAAPSPTSEFVRGYWEGYADADNGEEPRLDESTQPAEWGIPAAAPEPLAEEQHAARRAWIRSQTVANGAIDDSIANRCPTCGSTDRAVRKRDLTPPTIYGKPCRDDWHREEA